MNENRRRLWQRNQRNNTDNTSESSERTDRESSAFFEQYAKVAALFDQQPSVSDTEKEELPDEATSRSNKNVPPSRQPTGRVVASTAGQTPQGKTVMTWSLLNLEKMADYYSWSQVQTWLAFKLAVGLSIAGFSLMAIAVICVVVFNTTTEVTIMAAVGGAVTELIAATALYVYKSSVTQMEHYHRALHEDQRFLSSVFVAQGYDSHENRESILSEIIRNQLAMNVLETQLEAYKVEKPSNKEPESKDNPESNAEPESEDKPKPPETSE